MRWRGTQTANKVTGCCCKVTGETTELANIVYRGTELKHPSRAVDNSQNTNDATPSKSYFFSSHVSKSDFFFFFFLTDCRWACRSASILTLFQKHCSKNNTPAGMPQGHFPGFSQKRTLDVYEDTEVCREEYLFSWQFCREYSNPFPLCPSLNSHPFVCHRVYLYITNLHQG